MINSDGIEYLYRYRSVDSLLGYNELENLNIYLAKPNELNDPIEDFINIVWKGDEIAFQSLFKHYLYALYHLYSLATLNNPDEKLDAENLPIFMSYESLSFPEMETIFKDIFESFFDDATISQFPILLQEKELSVNAEELSCILKTIHLFAYLVIHVQIKKHVFKNDLLADSNFLQYYNFAKSIISNEGFIEFLKYPNTPQKLRDYNEVINKFNTLIAKIMIKDNTTKSEDLELLIFKFPELYLKQIKRLLYPGHYIACFASTGDNELMWGHYAAGHNGVCLKFKTYNSNNNKMIDLYPIKSRSYGSEGLNIKRDFIPFTLYPVKYSDNCKEIDFFKSLGCLPMPVIKDFWLSNYDKTRISNLFDFYKNEDIWRANYHKEALEQICEKTKNWDYEAEHRIILREMFPGDFDNKSDRILKFKFSDLDSITFGMNTSDDNRKKIINIIKIHCKNDEREKFDFYETYYSYSTNKIEVRYLCGIN